MSVNGAPLTRVDGQLKVMGTAKYAAEFSAPNTPYAVIMQSTIPNGRIASMDASLAERAAGVVAILTPQNAPKLAARESRVSVLQNDQVR